MKVKLILVSIALIGISVVVMVLGLQSNPTADEAARHYAAMEHDFDQLLAPGDKVVRSSGDSKFGGAYLTKSIRWGGQTFSTYEKKALQLGWRKLVTGAMQYCKDQMLFVVNRDGRLSTGENVLYMEMSFDVTSIRTCRGER